MDENTTPKTTIVQIIVREDTVVCLLTKDEFNAIYYNLSAFANVIAACGNKTKLDRIEECVSVLEKFRSK